MKSLFLGLALVAATPAFAADGTPINESRPLKPDGRVSVSNLSGEIKVTAWDRGEVKISGTLGEGSEELRITGDTESLEVEVVLPRRSHNVEASYLQLMVPKGARIELKSVSADLVVDGTQGDARLSTVSGEVTLDGKMREMRIGTVSGDMKLNAPSVDTRIETVSGDVVVSGISGKVELQTVSGDLTVSGGRFSSIEAETVSGEIEITAAGLEDKAEVEVESVSGDLKMLLPGPLNAEVRLDTFSGRVKSDFGKAGRQREGRFEAVVGSGSARIRMDSHSGDLVLRKNQ